MKQIFLIVLISFFSVNVFAELSLDNSIGDFEPISLNEKKVKYQNKKETKYLFEYGTSATFHPMADTVISQNFKNKLSKNGLWVQNPRYTFSAITTEGNSYSKLSLFATRDCLDQSAFGATYSFGVITDGRWVHAGLMIGGYGISTQAWEDIQVKKYWLDIGKSAGIVPLIGFELNLSIIKTKHFEVNFHNFVSPLLTNHALTVGIGF